MLLAENEGGGQDVDTEAGLAAGEEEEELGRGCQVADDGVRGALLWLASRSFEDLYLMSNPPALV